MHTYIQTYIHAYVHTYVHTNIHTHTHTHTYTANAILAMNAMEKEFSDDDDFVSPPASITPAHRVAFPHQTLNPKP